MNKSKIKSILITDFNSDKILILYPSLTQDEVKFNK
jgi:hypothetical protein